MTVLFTNNAPDVTIRCMYKLISFDMDGTLLTSENTISKESCRAISEAAGKGREIILCTGRSIAELADFDRLIPEVRYAICVSGSIIYDRTRKDIFLSKTIAPGLLQQIFDIAGEEDTMIHLLGHELVIQKDQCYNYPRYHMERLAALYKRIGNLVPDIHAYYREHADTVMKVNIYHTSPEARLRTRERLLQAGLDVALKDAEITSLEVTRNDVTKAAGFRELCSHLKIDVSSTIAVGDADNDLDVLTIAGLPVAMGNALPHVKDIVLRHGGCVVSDNDHGGCAEAIQKYLLD